MHKYVPTDRTYPSHEQQHACNDTHGLSRRGDDRRVILMFYCEPEIDYERLFLKLYTLKVLAT